MAKGIVTEVPGYTKVLTLGARGTERIRTATRGLAEWYKAQLLEAVDASTK